MVNSKSYDDQFICDGYKRLNAAITRAQRVLEGDTSQFGAYKKAYDELSGAKEFDAYCHANEYKTKLVRNLLVELSSKIETKENI